MPRAFFCLAQVTRSRAHARAGEGGGAPIILAEPLCAKVCAHHRNHVVHPFVVFACCKLLRYGANLAAYVLSRAGSSQAGVARSAIAQQLRPAAKGRTGSYWDIAFGPKPAYGRAYSIDVEGAGYGLMALMEGGETHRSQCEDVAAWLAASRDKHGGWHGTQATVVGLDALAMPAAAETPTDKAMVTVTGAGSCAAAGGGTTPSTVCPASTRN